jgi:uridine kinase
MESQLSLPEIISQIKSGERRNKRCRIIAIDGPAGAGKSTLASRIAMSMRETNIEIVHMDDLYSGWEDALTNTLTKTLEFNIAQPASQGKPFEYRKYNWLTKQFGEFLRIIPQDLLILEGVGAGQKSIRKYLDQLIWIDIEPEIGLNRVLQRDGDYLEAEMRVWQMRESEHFERDNTRDCATIRIDGKRFI